MMLSNQQILFILTPKLLLGILLVSIIACTKVSPPPVKIESGQHIPSVADGKSWWYYRVKINRPKDSAPNWAIGALVAGEVYSPTLKNYRQDIELWRFHRRAGADKSGHLFSFIFFTSAQTAQLIYNDLENNAVLLDLLRLGKLDSTHYDDVRQLTRPNIEDTSDKSWPLIIQQSWPDYIMGVSQMWLNQVHALADKHVQADVIDQYAEVQKELTTLWKQNGQHAWLHHLNALYAYEPFLIRY